MSKKTIFFIGSQDDQAITVPNLSLVGNKGFRNILNARQGYPVPDGFVISTAVCRHYLALGAKEARKEFLTDYVNKLVIPAMEKMTGNSEDMPLVSVRSTAADSMPGMMETILNVLLGTNVAKLQDWRKTLGDKTALDCMARLVTTYSKVVKGISLDGVTFTSKATMEDKIRSLLKAYKIQAGEEFPKSGRDQLIGAIGAVFESWLCPRAVEYRKIHGIPDEGFTACIIQTMVFGNAENSCSGVLFTRNPNTGENFMTGEWIPGQGEDVVSGTKNPKNLSSLGKYVGQKTRKNLFAMAKNLEKEFGDVQDIEFTIENGEIWLLQSRTAKRTATAAWKIACDFHLNDGMGADEALATVKPHHFRQLNGFHVAKDNPDPDGQGLAASLGLAAGKVTTSVKKATTMGDWILLRHQTVPDDLEGMKNSKGIITEVGGMTCHAAVVARDLGIPAIVGVGSDHGLKEGTPVWIDGGTGRWWTQPIKMIHECFPPGARPLLESSMKKRNLFLKVKHLDEAPGYPKIIVETYDSTIESFEKIVASIAGADSTKEFIVLDLSNENNFQLEDDDEAWRAFGIIPPRKRDSSLPVNSWKITALKKWKAHLDSVLIYTPIQDHALELRKAGFTNVIHCPKNLEEAIISANSLSGTSAISGGKGYIDLGKILGHWNIEPAGVEALQEILKKLQVGTVSLSGSRSFAGHVFDILAGNK